MKIIKPMDFTSGGLAENSAPPDEYLVWEPVGRNFFSDITSPVIGASQSHIFFADDKVVGVPVYKIDPDTGAYETLSYIVSDNSVYGLFPSPDGQYLAILHGNSVIRVYNTVNGTIVYSAQAYRDEHVSWSADSSTMSYLGFSSTLPDPAEWAVTPVVLSTSNWVQVAQFSESQIEAMYKEDPSGAYGEGHTFEGYVSVGGACYYTMTTVETYQVGGPPTMAIRKSIIGKLTALGSNTYIVRQRVEGPSSSTAMTSPAHLFYNPNKGHILGYLNSNFYAFDGVTFAQDTDTPTLSGVYQRGIYPSLDASEFIVTNTSVQPYLRRYDAANYTVKDDLDGQVGGYTSEIDYSSDYIAFKDPLGGYGLIDKLTAERVTQVNPTVTKGDIYTYRSRNYEALKDNNDRPDLGVFNVDAEGNADPTWLDLGFVNPLRMFDGKLDSRTTAPDVLTITVNPGVIANGLALFNVSAQSVQVTVDDPVDGLVYDSGAIAMLDNSAISNWWEFFYSPYVAKADLALTDLPPYPDAEITITISNPGDVAAIGEMVLGRIQSIGEIQYGTNVGIIDSSTKERDVFGNFEIIERKFSKRAEFDVSMTTGSVSGVQRILAGYRASPVVWIGEIDYEATIVYGFYRDFQLNFSHYSLSDATITVEGL